MRANHKMQRLYCDAPMAAGATVEPAPEQLHYLLNVLRLKQGDEIFVFNGRDGEWRATVQPGGRKKAGLLLSRCERPQPPAPDLLFGFAPLKAGRLDYLVQKAVEMGAGIIQPVITRHTQLARLGDRRMLANIIEAAEQCGVLSVPEYRDPVKFDALLAGWEPNRRLIFCDEAAGGENPLAMLVGLGRGPLGVIIGPEGGFSDDERRTLRDLPFVTAIPLGPRILRADTAAVAALAVVQAALGDW
ncbi:MAG: 16S rRNA (uracil(1498)-N(3))-methyltransferase [Rhizobiaceae bacterium]